MYMDKCAYIHKWICTYVQFLKYKYANIIALPKLEVLTMFKRIHFYTVVIRTKCSTLTHCKCICDIIQ